MSALTIQSGATAGPAESCEAPAAVAVSLEGIHAPAAFVDRDAHILHANSNFYALTPTADLGESQWVDAFERPSVLRVQIETIDNDHALCVAHVLRAVGLLPIWIVVSANAQPMPGRRDTIRLVSLHCGSEAVRLQLALRAGDVIAEGVCARALDRHLALLSHQATRPSGAARPSNPTRDVLDKLAAQAPAPVANHWRGAAKLEEAPTTAGGRTAGD